jgi:hypothetical protein
MTYQSFNIIAVIRLTFCHALSAYRRQTRRFDPPFAQIAPVLLQMTPPRTPTPLSANRC